MSPAEGFAFLALPLTVTSKRRPPTPSRLACSAQLWAAAEEDPAKAGSQQEAAAIIQ